MKRWIALLLCILLAGCNAAAKEILPEESSPIQRGTPEYDSFLEKTPGDERLFQPLWDFTQDTGAALFAEEGSNVNYSPLSLYTALSLLQAGAQGETQKEILHLLNVQNPQELELINGRLEDWFRLENEDSAMKRANALWIGAGVPWSPAEDFVAALNAYNASLHQVDFASDKTAQIIKAWVEEQTEGHLSWEMEFMPDTEAVVMNTLYFKSPWINRTYEQCIEDRPFTTGQGQEIMAPTMFFKEHTGWEIRDRYTLVDKYLQTGKIRFILPAEGLSPQDLLEEENFGEILRKESDESGEVKLYLPKYDITSHMDFSDALEALGMEKAFFRTADFTKMGLGDLRVTTVIQRSRITLDEEGVEASAVTEIANASEAPLQEEPPEIHLDRPFMYCLSYGDIPLFIGICANPLE